MKKYSFKDYIRDMATQLRTLFFHGEYRMDIFYMEEDDVVNGTKTAAAIGTDTIYLRFNLKIYPCMEIRWKDKEYKEIGLTMVHEMCHLLTEPQYQFAHSMARDCELKECNDIRERQTQRTANVILELLEEDWYLPKNILKRAKPSRSR